MSDLDLYTARLERIFQEITDAYGDVDVKGVGSMGEVNKRIDEVRDILAKMPLGLTQLQKRMDSDPDLSRFSRKRRLEALADYLRFAIGLTHQQPDAARGRIIVGANNN